jgi:glycosyltransferase involved in cell wall biosynthesis
MKLKFTIITVTFNAEKKIKKTIESVLKQSVCPYEYIVIDGKSTDCTLEIIESYRKFFEEKGTELRVFSEADTGIYNAMNKGIRYAKGDFISFLNAGDWYENDALKNVQNLYNEESFELTYGGLHYINPNGTITNKMSKLDHCPVSSRNWNHPSMFLKRDIYQKYEFDERFKIYADFDLYLKLRKDGTKTYVIDKVLTNFVADGISTNIKVKNVLSRSKEKYKAYRENGYGRLYWIESYGWEIFKALYFWVRS